MQSRKEKFITFIVRPFQKINTVNLCKKKEQKRKTQTSGRKLTQRYKQNLKQKNSIESQWNRVPILWTKVNNTDETLVRMTNRKREMVHG